MAATHFSGPVVSTNGFSGGGVVADTATATVTINGTKLIITNLPTVDPAVAGQIYSNAGVLTVSAG